VIQFKGLYSGVSGRQFKPKSSNSIAKSLMNGIAKLVQFTLEKRNFQNNFPHFLSKKVQDF
jgi:hypothetical protein